MSLFKISRAINKFTLNRQTLIKVQNLSSASIPSTKNLKVEKFNAIKNMCLYFYCLKVKKN